MRRGSILGKPRPRCIKPPARGMWNSRTIETPIRGIIAPCLYLRSYAELQVAMTKGSNAMTKSRIKLPAVLSLTVLSVAFLVSFAFFNVASSLPPCTDACRTGYNDCRRWCRAMKKAGDITDLNLCYSGCTNYWYSGKNPQFSRIGGGDPTNPPQKIGPGRVENPPNTVSPPMTPPWHTGPGRVENPPTNVSPPRTPPRNTGPGR
jgi:hypothetical protein